MTTSATLAVPEYEQCVILQFILQLSENEQLPENEQFIVRQPVHYPAAHLFSGSYSLSLCPIYLFILRQPIHFLAAIVCQSSPENMYYYTLPFNSPKLHLDAHFCLFIRNLSPCEHLMNAQGALARNHWCTILKN